MRRLDDGIILPTTVTTTTTTTTITTTLAAAATAMNLAGYSFACYCVGSEFESRPCNEQSRRNFLIFCIISYQVRGEYLTIVHDCFLMHSSIVLVDAVHLHCGKRTVKQLGSVYNNLQAQKVQNGTLSDLYDCKWRIGLA